MLVGTLFLPLNGRLDDALGYESTAQVFRVLCSEERRQNLISAETLLGFSKDCYLFNQVHSVLNTVLSRMTLYPTESQAIFHFQSLRKMISSDKSLRIAGFFRLIKSPPHYLQNLLRPVNGLNFSSETN